MIQKRIIALVLLLLTLCTQAQESPKYEIRAVWLTTIGGIDWPHTYRQDKQKEELCHTLDRLKQAGINTVLLQTRIRATTIYPTVLEPWDGCLTGKPGRSPGYDPLQLAIDECHKRGMQLHAWVVTIPVGKWNSYGCMQLRKKQPGLIIKIGDDGFMNPELPETADYLAHCCQDIVKRYDVDGIHLDYIRYPENWPKAAKGRRQRGRRATRTTTLQTRRDHITHIVQAIHDQVKAVKPWVMLSCSPIGKYDDLARYSSRGWNARTAVCQDAQKWLKDSLMDALFPMMYFRDNNFFPFAIDWQEHSYGRIVVPGLGIYFLDPKEGNWQLGDVTRQMHVSRQLGIGHCYFRSKFLTDNHKGIYDFAANFDATPALIPPMTWATDNEMPNAPRQLELTDGILSWNDSSSDQHLYNIYASTDFPVDIDKAENLIATRLPVKAVSFTPNPMYNYAVTCQDRYGRESMACQLLVNAGAPTTHTFFARTDGQAVRLPEKPSTFDAYFVAVETLFGKQLLVLPYPDKDNLVDVSSLPEGIYQIRAIGRKKRNHRIGFFAIKHEKEPQKQDSD